MEQKQKASLIDYIPLPTMIVVVFTAASLIFTYAFGMGEPVPVFIFFAVVQVLAILLFVLLPDRLKRIARNISMIIIGSTILFLAGILGRQNFQFEGLVFILLGGFFGGPVIHFIMKISGSLLSGRSWCSWGCWTAAVLDFLPYKSNTQWQNSTLSRIRYLHFAMSIALVVILVVVFDYTITDTPTDAAGSGKGNMQIVYWFVTGNLFYYLAGIILALKLKDNRAFCKYLCPVAVPLKAAGIFSILRIEGKDCECSGCRKCEEKCPSSIGIHSYIHAGERVTSTECMMCLNCVAACPRGNLKASLGMDMVRSERLKTASS